ncbi:hypothetical protein [Clostridium oryzae]|uniref:Prenyltransferase and squalene oxidase repeat protein n=1 Tax=Clostridium oryzae TaxID=1450648 RepID=A0A1V4IUA1_9CLOT|nr:hypothetical protein [Clostridium oryzae]OPJ63602.1 hypothetical protein CLORY_11100 [Clostridium oryzae]
MKISKSQFDLVKRWMYRNARPLDIARWKYHFENGTKEEVLAALGAYQNQDGGFGHALEADSWNPNSAPIQTWCATEVLHELGITDKNNEIVKGILSYLESGKDFHEGYWYAEIPSNDDYPHAPWWSDRGNVVEHWGYNPTISLVGFILYFADKQSKLYGLASEIAEKAVHKFFSTEEPEGMHELSCFISFCGYCEKAKITNIIDMVKLRKSINRKVKLSIEDEKERWKTDYVCKPSYFMITPDSVFYNDNKELADYEVEFIIETMNDDGTWNINWDWGAYPEEWALSKNWWKANQNLINLRYLKGHNCL